jgi:G3E family GTPase
MNLSGLQKRQTDPVKLALVKTWIYEALRLDADTTLSISQLSCTEPNCPPIETVVAVMIKPPQQYKIHKAIADIEHQDILNLAVPTQTPSKTQNMISTDLAIQLDVPKQGMPVTIITGFLGSGKTTLLNQILKNRQDLKVAVLVNEFGDINIDSQLLVDIDDDMVELSNGCICCTINDGLVDAVYRVLEREDRVDYMVIETTGVADPLPIALTFLATELKNLTRLDSILTVIDAEAFTPSHFDSEAARNQVSYGDIILLNKTDLASESQVDELENYIRTTKAGSRILRSHFGEVPLPLILDVGLAHHGAYQPEEKNHDHEHHHDHSHEHEHHHHHSDHLANDGFVSVSFQSDRPFSLEKFQDFLGKLMPEDVFRAKGVLRFEGIDLRYIFQLTGKRYELQHDFRDKPLINQLVLIGRNLNPQLLQQQLRECQVC